MDFVWQLTLNVMVLLATAYCLVCRPQYPWGDAWEYSKAGVPWGLSWGVAAFSCIGRLVVSEDRQGSQFRYAAHIQACSDKAAYGKAPSQPENGWEGAL